MSQCSNVNSNTNSTGVYKTCYCNIVTDEDFGTKADSFSK